VRLTVTKDWKIAAGDGATLCVFSLGEAVQGDLEVHAKSDRTPEQEADLTEQGFKEADGVKRVTRAKEEKPKRPAGDWLRREVVVEHARITLRYVMLYVKRGATLFTLAACCDEAEWKKLEEAIGNVMDAFVFLDGGSPNPWAGCGPGSWARFRVTFEIGPEGRLPPPPEIRTVTLVDRDAESYTVRTDRGVEGGKVHEGVPERIALAKKAGADGKVETGEETLTSGQKGGWSLKCAWTKTTRERGWTKVWTCDDVPGRVVKVEESDGGGRGHTMTLVEFEKKK